MRRPWPRRRSGARRAVAARPLRTLRLSDPGRRLGGQALTDLTARQGPARVTDEPDIIGAHPGASMKYQVTADLAAPEDPDLACRDRAASATFPLTIKLTPQVPPWDQEAPSRTPEPFRERVFTTAYVLPPKTCFIAARVTDVYRNEAGTGIAVVVAITIDAGFSDAAEYRGAVFSTGR